MAPYESPVWFDRAMDGANIRVSESVTEGHPDKMMDVVADGILDCMMEDAELLRDKLRAEGNPDWEKVHPERTRAAIEGVVKGDGAGGMLILAGEVTPAFGVTPRYEDIARRIVKHIGYDDPDAGFSDRFPKFFTNITEQSPDIAHGVGEDNSGAGDQGIFFGYATNEHPSLMPMPIQIAHSLTAALTEARRNGQLEWLKPDGKSQVGINYVDGVPTEIAHVTLAAAHDRHHLLPDVRQDLYLQIIVPVLAEYGLKLPKTDIRDIVNGTGAIIINGAGAWDQQWGPLADTGVVGRKLDVDTYGGAIPHGGGALSGKDPTKVDRSAKYAARFIAQSLVRENVADRIQVSLAYTIGQRDPDSVRIDTFGTEHQKSHQIYHRAAQILDLSVPGIIEGLGLTRTRFEPTARNGHFGKPEFPWEQAVK